jgi:hypothetical protein
MVSIPTPSPAHQVTDGLEQTTVMGMPTYDIIGITSHGLFWTMVETNVALIAFCLPTLRPILSIAALGTAITSFGRFLRGLKSASGSTRSQKQPSSKSHRTGQASKLGSSLHSAWRSRNSRNEITEISTCESKIDLLEMGQANVVKVTRHNVRTLDSYEEVDMRS